MWFSSQAQERPEHISRAFGVKEDGTCECAMRMRSLLSSFVTPGRMQELSVLRPSVHSGRGVPAGFRNRCEGAAPGNWLRELGLQLFASLYSPSRNDNPRGQDGGTRGTDEMEQWEGRCKDS